MPPDEQLMQQLVETFNTELESLLSVITANLKLIERGESVNRLSQMLEEISRAGRNIKVSALSVGVPDLGPLAESIELLFSPTHSISLELINLSFRAVDGMREAMRNFIDKKASSAVLQSLINELKQQASIPVPVKNETKAEAEAAPSTDEIGSAAQPTPNGLENEFIKKIIETFKAELQENVIIISDGLLQLEKGVKSENEFQALLDELFRVAHNIKGSARGIGASDVGEIAHHIESLFAALQKKRIRITQDLINLCLQAIDRMNEAMECYSAGIPLPFDLEHFSLQLQRHMESAPQKTLPAALSDAEQSLAPGKTSPSQETDLKSSEFESIRVSLNNLDRISAYMEEIQAIKIAIEDYYSKLTQINFKLDHVVQSWKKSASPEDNHEYADTPNAAYHTELSEISQTLSRIQRECRTPVNELSVLLNALQEEIRTLRLIPVTSQLAYLPRIVRDLSHELNKQVNLEIKSNNVKIDKMILDGLKDPIIHLLRNAIDHGIENRDEREAAGKPAQGTIIIDVNQEDNAIVFRISDDGAGIKIDDVINQALQKNLISPADLEHMKPDDIYELIYRPGFSTRTIATDISGRGVGLDVVRSNLIRLKGQVSLNTRSGKGTDFFLRVPLTLATERGLIVTCNQHSFVLITHSIERVLLVKQQDIVHVEGCPCVLVKEQAVLLCSLSSILQLNENKKNIKEYASVVIIKINNDRIALQVDEIIGEKEIVLKPLHEPLTNLPCIIGATLTGSNQISFVLNASELIKGTLP